MKHTLLLFMLMALSSASILTAGNPCASLAVDSVQVTDVSCNGGSDGQITVFASGGSGPYTYSNGQSSAGSPITVLQNFNNSGTLYNGSSVTGAYYSPATCTPGNYFAYASSGGCSGGAAYYNGSGSGGYSGCYLRTPMADASGLTAVTMNFDISHSYNSGRPNDKITFSIWINNGYRNTSIVPVTINGVAANELTFDQARTCERVEVVFDISSATLTDKSDMLLYINSSCGYSNCNTYNVTIDNIEVLEGGGSGSGFQGSSNFTNLPADTYTVTIEDNTGCQATYTLPVVVSEPPALGIIMDGTNPTSVGGSDGKVWVTPNGGVLPYTYAWSNAVLSTDTATGRSAGSHCVTVTDNNGCATSGCYTLTAPACNLNVSNVAKTSVTCPGGNDGTITITAANAIGAVEYSIDNGSTWSSSNTFGPLAAGAYRAVVRDAQGCTASWPSNTIVSMPALWNASTSVTDISIIGATDGAINLIASGGTLPYTYEWSNGPTTEDISGLAPNTYTVTITDARGCTTTASGTVNQPGCAVTLSETHDDISCNGLTDGSITVTPTGGTAPYQYSIDGGNTYQAGGSFSSLGAGSYTITTEDANQCTASVSVTIIEPTVLGVSVSTTSISAPGATDGTAEATQTGGTAPYAYMWSTGATTRTISGLGTSSYCVTVTDGNNCTATSCATVSINSAACNGFAISNVAVVQPTCPNQQGSITVNITGGNNPVLYSVDSGATFQNGVSLFSLAPGTYNVLVRDNAGCELVYNANPITINAPAVLNPRISSTTTGFAIVDTFVSYRWLRDGKAISGQIDTALTTTTVGDYAVEVTDSRGCKDTSNTLSITVGIEDVELLSAVKLYPNPVTDKLNIESSQTQAITVTLTDLQGRTIRQSTFEQGTGSVDVSNVAKGMYLIQLRSGDELEVRKVLVK